MERYWWNRAQISIADRLSLAAGRCNEAFCRFKPAIFIILLSE